MESLRILFQSFYFTILWIKVLKVDRYFAIKQKRIIVLSFGQ